MKKYISSVTQFFTQTNFMILCVLALVVLISLNIAYTVSAHNSINELNTFLLDSIYAGSFYSTQIRIPNLDTFELATFTLPKGYCLKTLKWVSAVYNTSNPLQEEVKFSFFEGRWDGWPNSDTRLTNSTSIFASTPPTVIGGSGSKEIVPIDGPTSVCAQSGLDRVVTLQVQSLITPNEFSQLILDFEIYFQPLYDYVQ